ncbi:unnamed protein product [Plutella xylostella]|uniref:(diamondback moth) hypothetical protein n=1 Tax=Plutella xylostella TaxID=51655 RepID=A0A8S4FXF4_PLUXY|nr:unnamed protein product [Plutella xylostella]
MNLILDDYSRVHYSDLEVHVGMHDRLDRNHQVVRIKYGLKHPNFRSNAVRDINDIAVLTLNRRVQFSDVVRPICLPESGTEEDWTGLTMTVAGWGKTRQEALTSSRYLLETRVRLVDGATCQRNSIYSDNLEPNTMICAYNLGKDACQGDSGGPMFGKLPNANKRKYYQIGIVSWGIDCAKPDYPGVYTNVRKYKEWIKQETADGMYCR